MTTSTSTLPKPDRGSGRGTLLIAPQLNSGVGAPCHCLLAFRTNFTIAMGKAKRRKVKPFTPNKPYSRASAPNTKPSSSSHKPSNGAHPSTPPVPFSPDDRILLVGEGDFSFSNSLLSAHGCTHLVATSYDKISALREKYPQATSNIAALEAEEDCVLRYGVDATKLGKPGVPEGGGGAKEVKKGGFDKVVFNFPHVGGLTKDVNRQVRHNQELLVGFFKAALPLLAPLGSIIVTTFDGEPYELWNVRDLARHVGLKVERSFKFQASSYPGYQHVRTLGNIEGGGGWKGVDRPARTYVFGVKDGGTQGAPRSSKKREGSDSEDG